MSATAGYVLTLYAYRGIVLSCSKGSVTALTECRGESSYMQDRLGAFSVSNLYSCHKLILSTPWPFGVHTGSRTVALTIPRNFRSFRTFGRVTSC